MAVTNKTGSVSRPGTGSKLGTDSPLSDSSNHNSGVGNSSIQSDSASYASSPTFSSQMSDSTADHSQTKSVTVNAAFLEEVKTIHHELWHLLEATKLMCSKQQRTSHWQAQFVKSMEELRDLFAMQFALEEGYGYFDEPAFVESNTSERARTLRNDHKLLYQEINEIAEWLVDLRHTGDLAMQMAEVKLRFESFCEKLQTHEKQEQELIFEAYCDDIGTGD